MDKGICRQTAGHLGNVGVLEMCPSVVNDGDRFPRVPAERQGIMT
ncbi:hypothetical protein RBLE17_18610 [Rhodobacteraceae bacterium LE17]|nr:hypothetical protein [Rhodobacteraceae bacterium LE17]